MATIDDYLAYVAPEVEGCPRGVMIRELIAAAIRFCRQSYYLNASQAIPLSADVVGYTLDPGADWSVISVIDAKFNGRDVPIKDVEWMNNNLPDWSGHEGQEPLYVWSEDGATLNVYPRPNALVSGSLDVKMAVQPARTSQAWLDNLYDNYLECIAHGAKASLLMMKGRQWYDPQQASYCASMFKNGYLEAKREVMKGFSNTSLSHNPITLGA